MRVQEGAEVVRPRTLPTPMSTPSPAHPVSTTEGLRPYPSGRVEEGGRGNTPCHPLQPWHLNGESHLQGSAPAHYPHRLHLALPQGLQGRLGDVRFLAKGEP